MQPNIVQPIIGGIMIDGYIRKLLSWFRVIVLLAVISSINYSFRIAKHEEVFYPQAFSSDEIVAISSNQRKLKVNKMAVLATSEAPYGWTEPGRMAITNITKSFSNASTPGTYRLTTANITVTSTEELSMEHDMHTCKDVEQLEIIKRVGKGGRKVAYEVKLPSGQHVLAKRCKRAFCQSLENLEHEVAYLKGLLSQYGKGNAIEVYGECAAETFLHKNLQAYNFSTGYTYLVELGQPFFGVKLWKSPDRHRKHKEIDVRRKCFASYFTHRDIEDFKEIARQYSNYSGLEFGWPIVLANPKTLESDNMKFENYAITKAGIRHVDLDEIWECEHCSYDEALEINCSIIREVTQIKNLNCSAVKHNVSDHRINSTEAIHYCSNPKNSLIT